ncbi:calcium-binding protein, partial [Ancylobacter lacus]|uniref:calcium-binding protein n=1 Tax=Ancylobacter lacus TaxID=2579970 RepID=UPI001BD12227
GNDVIWTAGSALTTVYGDEFSASGSSSSNMLQFGNDTIDASAATAATTIYGDTSATVFSMGGNDTITGSGYGDFIYGDATNAATNASTRATGGNDVIHGGGGNDSIYGDSTTAATQTSAFFTGGADTLYGDDGQDTLYGDTVTFGFSNALITRVASTTCGNDTLYGGADDDTLIGDGATVAKSHTLTCGNDRLDGGTGDDKLYGDVSGTIGSGATVTGGNDTFVFQPGSGADTIYDFGQTAGSSTGDDLIDVSAYGYTNFDSLSIANNGTASVTITFSGSGNSVTVQNKANTALTLDASDFVFAA